MDSLIRISFFPIVHQIIFRMWDFEEIKEIYENFGKLVCGFVNLVERKSAYLKYMIFVGHNAFPHCTIHHFPNCSSVSFQIFNNQPNNHKFGFIIKEKRPKS